jgi:hypothetical protein
MTEPALRFSALSALETPNPGCEPCSWLNYAREEVERVGRQARLLVSLLGVILVALPAAQGGRE